MASSELRVACSTPTATQIGSVSFAPYANVTKVDSEPPISIWRENDRQPVVSMIRAGARDANRCAESRL